MQAARFRNGSVFIDTCVPKPAPGAGEALIAVAAAGVIPAELSWYPTTHQKNGEPRIGAIPGHEFSGVVAGLGGNTGNLAVGDEIFGMNDWFSGGALAEYCVAPAAAIAAKPGSLSAAEAASVPISALTAWQGLFDRAKLRRGEHALVHGGAGAVGMFAVQLAHLSGARVSATASAQNLDFVRSLGAQEAFDYRETRFEDAVKNVDVVFDTVGGETLARSWRALGSGGRVITVASAEADSPDPRVQKAFFIVESNQNQLAEIGRLLDDDRLRTTVESIIPFAEVPRIYAGEIPRQGRGKVVVSLAAAPDR